MTLHHMTSMDIVSIAIAVIVAIVAVLLALFFADKPEAPRHRIHQDVAELAAQEPDESWADVIHAANTDNPVPAHEPPARAPLLTNGGWPEIMQAPGWTFDIAPPPAGGYDVENMTMAELEAGVLGIARQVAYRNLPDPSELIASSSGRAGELDVTGPAAGNPPPAPPTPGHAGPVTHPDYADVLPSYVIDALRTAHADPADTVTSSATLRPWLRELLSCPADQIEAAANRYTTALARIAEHDRQLFAGTQARSLMIVQAR